MDAARMKTQELALALGMALSTGMPIIVGGEKCPPIRKIISALKDSGWNFRRLTKDEKEDDMDDFGGMARHAITSRTESPAVHRILNEEIEYAGEKMCVQDYLLLHI